MASTMLYNFNALTLAVFRYRLRSRAVSGFSFMYLRAKSNAFLDQIRCGLVVLIWQFWWFLSLRLSSIFSLAAFRTLPQPRAGWEKALETRLTLPQLKERLEEAKVLFKWAR